jgi:hypothetical protein
MWTEVRVEQVFQGKSINCHVHRSFSCFFIVIYHIVDDSNFAVLDKTFSITELGQAVGFLSFLVNG